MKRKNFDSQLFNCYINLLYELEKWELELQEILCNNKDFEDYGMKIYDSKYRDKINILRKVLEEDMCNVLYDAILFSTK